MAIRIRIQGDKGNLNFTGRKIDLAIELLGRNAPSRAVVIIDGYTTELHCELPPHECWRRAMCDLVEQVYQTGVMDSHALGYDIHDQSESDAIASELESVLRSGYSGRFEDAVLIAAQRA